MFFWQWLTACSGIWKFPSTGKVDKMEQMRSGGTAWILQTQLTLEQWAGPLRCVYTQSLSGVRQAPLSTELSRQEYWSGLLFLSLGDLLDAGIEPVFLASPALAGGFFTILPSGKLTLKPGMSFFFFLLINIELAFCVCGFCILRFNQLWTADSIQNLRLVEHVIQNLWL